MTNPRAWNGGSGADPIEAAYRRKPASHVSSNLLEAPLPPNSTTTPRFESYAIA